MSTYLLYIEITQLLLTPPQPVMTSDSNSTRLCFTYSDISVIYVIVAKNHFIADHRFCFTMYIYKNREHVD